MLLPLILVFTLVPFLELYLLLAVASTLGVPETLGLCLLTGVVGGALARREGLAVWTQLHQQVAAGQLPGGALLEAFLVFAGGLLLLTPGVATDVLGFAMVLPPTRRLAARALAARLKQAISGGSVRLVMGGPGGPARGAGFPGFGPAPREQAPEESAGSGDPYGDTPHIRRL